jgi:limonene-1,2-epoxide hydrolase
VNAEEVVRAECEAWSTLDIDQIMAYFAADAYWWPAFSFPKASGYEEVRRTIDGFLKAMTKCEFEIVNFAVAGNVVLTERVDHIVLVDVGEIAAAGMGVFEVTGDKITAWRDYFYPEVSDHGPWATGSPTS